MTSRIIAPISVTVFLLTLFLTTAYLVPDVQSQGAGEASAAPHPHLSNDQLRERDAWFYGIRAYPLAHTPAGIRERALTQAQAMRQAASAATGEASLLSWHWNQIGPEPYQDSLKYSGRANAIAIDPRNNGTVYLGTAGGGIWKSVDSGAHWTAISDHQHSLATGAIAIDPNNPSTLYVGTGEANSSSDSYGGAGMMVSRNGGSTWQVLPFPLFSYGNVFGALAVNRVNSATLLAGHGTGIWRSTDSGQTWTQVLPGNTGYAAFFDATNPNIAYAAIGGIFGDPTNGVYKSIDAGAHWARLTGTSAQPFPSANLGRINLVQDTAGTLYASVSNCCAPFSAAIGIFKSSDGGGTWTKLTNPNDCCDWYRNAIAVSPTNRNVLLIGGADLWRSLDGGTTWTDIAGQGNGIHADQHSFAFTPDGSTLFVADDGGIFSSSTYQDATYSFNDLNSTLATITFYPGLAVDPANLKHVLGGTQDNGLEQYFGSLAWTPSDGYYCGDGGQAAFDPKNALYALSTCEGGAATLTRSIDGGRTNAGWQSAESGINLNEPHGWAPPVAFDPENEFAYYGTNFMYQSRDRGATWTKISGQLTAGTISAMAVAPNDEQVVYAGGSDGSLSVTQNALAGAGAAWTSINAGLPNAYVTSITVSRTNHQSVWVTLGGSGGGHVFHSTTGGFSWSDVSGNLPQITASRLAIDPDFKSQWFVATDVGVFVSTNGGVSWAPYGSGLPDVVVQDISIYEPGRTLVALTHGRSAWTVPLPHQALTITPSKLSFGTVHVGSASAAQTVTLYNPASASLAIGSIKLTGTQAANFKFTTTCTSSLAAHAKCFASVAFAPKVLGLLNAALAIQDQASSTPQTVSLSGTGN